jgi:dihydrofolate synthase / folylpolyglutamate synthase
MINDYLQSFDKFGIKLGLESIKNLLAILNNPQEKFPVIHVAGTNGKGSVCAYLSYVLTECGYKVGKYISPHLIDWNERITINNNPISTENLEEILKEIKSKLELNPLSSPTQFEVITAACFLYFAQQKVDIAIIEVGLGGRLDSTNVFDNPLLTVITSISRDHCQQLGETLGEIAQEKAGILKPFSPAIIGKLPLEANQVIKKKITEVNCPAIWIEPSILIKENTIENYDDFVINPPKNLVKFIPPVSEYFNFYELEYDLSLLGEFQLLNSAISITCAQILQQKGWKIPPQIMQKGISKTRWLGRLQWLNYKEKPILIDGAHNQDGAKFLRKYVDQFNTPITWIIGILSTKDYQEILKILLNPEDILCIVPIPCYDSIEPKKLQTLAQKICPKLKSCQTFDDLFIVLNNQQNEKSLTVLCGSLYLISYFLKNKNNQV